MRLSAPMFRLKRRARLLARSEGIPLNQALDQIARTEGFARWSLLAAHCAQASPCRTVLSRLDDGDLVLLGARPWQGKTVLGLQLLLHAAEEGRKGFFFTLVETEAKVAERLGSLGAELAGIGNLLTVSTSDDIGSDYIIRRLDGADPGTVAVIDYLQILDQQRTKPELSVQMSALRSFAGRTGTILVFLSQISRTYDPDARPLPDMQDINLPNHLDLEIFSKSCFLHEDALAFRARA